MNAVQWTSAINTTKIRNNFWFIVIIILSWFVNTPHAINNHVYTFKNDYYQRKKKQ